MQVCFEICIDLSFFSSFNVICEQLINIVLIFLIFRFTNIETARVLKSDWKTYIDSWFRKFEVSVFNKFNYFYVIL
jgi:hypothetical protein